MTRGSKAVAVDADGHFGGGAWNRGGIGRRRGVNSIRPRDATARSIFMWSGQGISGVR